ncbi:helix-turn-helix domain-containing protein [Gaiella occulta]|uniref:Helix-turn-helix domain-containing protein n=1 Tax=Gaiella occulta TaxID=1002870 RepID=A0A7M2YTR4_9ACTN|nr:helix-turn-helix transcriptional regulator [Gaiella occulta]RDI73284.1 helix-turn-helix domain-containing protein [Gaiella occulta]
MPPLLRTLREIRMGSRTTLRQLQDRTGINKGTLSQIERGRMVASPAELAAIADALGLDRLENRTVPCFEADAG